MNLRTWLNENSRVILIAGLILISIYSLYSYLDFVLTFLQTILSVLMPFIVAFFVAFLLAPLKEWIKKQLVSKAIKDPSLQNVISALLTIIMLFLILTLFFLFVIPQLITSITTLINNLPTFFEQLNSWVSNLNVEYDISQLLNQALQWVESNFEILLTSSYNILGSLWTTVVELVWGFILVLIFMMILLSDRQQLSLSIKKLLYSVFNLKIADELTSFTKMTSSIFRSYFIGQALDSLLLGAIIFVVLLILGFPYALLIGVIIMFTNMIPFFGPFMGAIPSILILLTVDYNYAIQFAIIILIAQQIDGNILSPYILGDSLQLPSFMIMFSITIFGGLFGLVGMIFGVPTFAVMYRLFVRFVNYRLEKL